MIGISDDGSDAESLVYRLPTELIILLFQQCESDIRSRLALTHTCQLWRQIAVNTASLWTNIVIRPMARKWGTHFDNFISIMGMQLDRIANLLLDVEWITRVDDEFFVATLRLIREKAPFRRWRTLKMDLSGHLRHDASLSSIGAFTNLEVLVVCGNPHFSVLGVIDCMITSRLKVLDVTGPSRLRDILRPFEKSLTHISSLRLRLENYRSSRDCIMDLQRVTTLTITGTLTIGPNLQVFLPALREIRLGMLQMDHNAKIEAPALNHLHLMNFRPPPRHF